MFANITYIPIFIILLYLGIFIYKKNSRNKVNVYFSFTILSIALWVFALFLSLAFKGYEQVLFWSKMSIIGPTFIFYFFLMFCHSFPDGEKDYNTKQKILFLIPALILLLLSPTKYNIESVIIKDWSVEAKAGPLYFYLVFYLIFFILASFINLYKKYQIPNSVVKEQIKYIFVGAGISSVLGLTTNGVLIALDISQFTLLGPLCMVFFIGFTMYAIVAHRLMNLKLVMRKYSVSILSFLAITIPATLVVQFYESIVQDRKILIDFVIIFLAIYFFPICNKLFYTFSNKYLFTSLYDSASVIAGMSEKLRSTLQLGKLYEHIYDSLNGALHLKAFAILGYQEKKNNYYIHYNRGFQVLSSTIFESSEKLHERFISQNKQIVVNEIEKEFSSLDLKAKKTLELLRKMKVELLVPLNVKDKNVGLLVLGEKESNDIYNNEDFKMLEVIGAQAAIAIENALLYEEAKKFNVKLEQEVERQTKELKVANEKLIKLDASKSEFISIASHQLRTPLTVIKGYISMILEGSFGRVSAVQRDSLNKVYLSNERLISLVENLLNLSRIESGRLQFKYETLNLETVVESVVDELKVKAKEKKIKLEYKKPIKPLPQVVIDQEKIRQVIMNLVDNSIKYTSKGGLTITVKQVDKNIEFCVSDSGMGIDPNDMPHLFQKFQRGTGTFLVHTEGTGLGLFVAKQMIAQHKGKIWAESEGRGKGSKFIFTIPINS